MSDRRQWILVVVAVAIGGITMSARAACNAIPDAASVGDQAASLLGLPSPTPAPARLGFKGALGRIDRLHLLPGKDRSVGIRPDGICVVGTSSGEPSVRPIPPLPDPSRVIVSLVARPAGGAPLEVLAVANEDACEVLAPLTKGGSEKARLTLRCDPTPPTTDPDGSTLRVHLPDQGVLRPGGADMDVPRSAPVTVLVTQAADTAAQYEALILRIATAGCAAECATLQRDDALACIDRIYAATASGSYATDPIPCAVGAATLAKNDFKERCEDLPTPNPDLVACDDQKTPLSFWTDVCGGVHIPFDWDAIGKTTTGTDVTRVVAGRSGTARAEKGQGERIWIPGREFVGSTPYADPQGTAPSTDWRLPDVDVWYPSGATNKQEVGLRGSVDQPDSIVHVFPYMPVHLLCDAPGGDEACMSAESGPRGSSIGCACTDRYAADCGCKEISPPRLFACDGGPYEGMPCTRHAHCNPNGKCAGQPSCQPTGEPGVWRSGRTHPPPHACWSDGDCQSIPGKPQCGYRLFDFTDRAVAGVVTLDATIPIPPAARIRRGVCTDDRTKACSNHPTTPKPCPTGDCRGYTLRAEDEL